MSSNRDLVLAGLKTCLEKITEANGFNHTVDGVYRKMMGYDDPEVVFPVLMILGGREEYEDELGGYTKSRMKFIVRGYAKDPDNPEVELNNTIQDVFKVLDNSTYNAYHKSYRPISLDTDEGWISKETGGVCIFEFVGEIIYRFLRSAP